MYRAEAVSLSPCHPVSLSPWRLFTLVWLGQSLSWLGSGLTAFALGLWIYERTGSPTQYVATVLVVTLPRIVLAPVAGPVVDRYDRRLVMVVSDLGAGLATVVLAGLLWVGRLDVWQIYCGVAWSAVCGTFQRPAYAASLPVLVPAQQLGRANGLIQVSRSTAELVAPILAGYLAVRIGIPSILLIDTITFLLAVSILLMVRFPESLSQRDITQAIPSLVREALEGWRYLRGRPGLFGLLLYTAAGNFLGITTEVLLAPYLLAITTADVLGWVLAMSGAGLLVGGLALSIWGGPRRRITGVFGFELVVCSSLIVVGLTSWPTLIGAAVFVCFIAIALSDGCAASLWQSSVQQHFLGRVFALREMVSYAALPLGLVITAPLAEYVFEPRLQPGGAWASSLGALLGTGPGRGMALVFLGAGLINMLIIGLAWSWAPIRNIEKNRELRTKNSEPT
jgi:DHA3 family macrolide efflux protein-like MFS transporter